MKTKHHHVPDIKFLSKSFRLIPVVIFFLVFASAVLNAQTTWYSYQSGDWETPSTWTTDPSGTLYINPSSLIPSGTNDVVLLNGRTVIKTTSPGSATALCNALDVKQGAIIDFRNTNNHTINTVNGQGIIRTQGTLPTVTNFNFNNAGGGTIEYSNTADFTFSVLTFNNLTLNFSDAEIVGRLQNNLLTINGNFVIQQGVFQINNNTGGASRTVNISGNLEVNSTGSIRLGTGNYNHTVTIKGDFINNGSVDFYEGSGPDYNGANYNNSAHADVIFDNDFADQNLICNGPSEFYRIEIDKGTDQTYILNIDADNTTRFNLYGRVNQYNGQADLVSNNNNALGLENGTVRLGPNIIIPALAQGGTSNGYGVPTTGQLWIDGATVSLTNTGGYNDANGIYVYGKVKFSANCNVSFIGQMGFVTREASETEIISGNISVSCYRASAIAPGHRGAFKMYGGNLTVTHWDVSGSTQTMQHGSFSIPFPDNVFIMSGGVIDILEPQNQGGNGRYFSLILGMMEKNANITGGTIRINTSPRNAYINSTIALPNLEVYGTANSLQVRNYAGTSPSIPITPQPLRVLNNLTLSGTTNLNTSNTGGTPAVVDLTVGGNFVIPSGTSYTPGNNTTTFNGTISQKFDNAGTITGGGLYNMVVSSIVNTNITNNLTVRNNLTINDSCFLQDMGRTIQVGGNIHNSGTHASQASGAILLNGSGAQAIGGDGSGIFGNLTINKGGGTATLTANQSLTGNLRLVNNGILNIGTFNLSLGASSNIYSTATTTVQNFSNAKMIVTSGNQSDGGVTKAYNATAPFLFPLGTGTDYTPALIEVRLNPTTWGSITVKPVAMRHLLLQGSNNAITYFWNTVESGFAGIQANSVIHRYYYVNSDIAGSEADYMPGRYNQGSWTTSTTFDVNESTNEILFNNVNYIDGDFTCGEASAFTGPVAFYSRNSAAGISGAGADWNSPSTWSTDPVLKWDGNAASSLPDASSVVIIGDGTVSHKVNTSAAATCGNLLIQENSTLDLSEITGHNFGAFPESKVSGSGRLMIAGTTFPRGDWGTFLGENGGTVEYYSTNTIGVNPLLIPEQYQLPSGASTNILSYKNLVISPGASKTINLPNTDLIIYENLVINSNGSNSIVQVNPGANTTTVTVQGDLLIRQNSAFRYSNRRVQNIVVEGSISIENNAVFDVSTGGATYNNTLTVWGNLINNGTLDMLPAANRYCNVIFKGNIDRQLSGTTAARTRLNTVTIDKGTTRDPVLDVTVNSTDFSLNTALTNALTLTNGTFRLSNGAVINLSTGPYTVPSTGCISVNNGTINIATGNASANDLLLDGRIEIMGTGVMNIGTPSNVRDNDIEYSSGGTPEIFISGGTLNVNGQVRRGVTINTGSLNYVQTGGIVNVYGENANNVRGIFEILNPGSNFSMSAGTLTIIRNFNNADYNDLYLAPATSSVTGGTLQFGQSGTTANNSQFNIVTSCPVGNIVVNGVTPTFNTTVNQRIYPVNLLGNLVINGENSVYSTSGLDITIGGNLLNNNTNAGTALNVGGFRAVSATQTTTFNGTGPQQIQGTGTNITNFANLVKNGNDVLSLSGTNSDIRVNANLTINSGTISDNTNDITVIQNISNSATHVSSGVTGGITLAGTSKQVISGNGSGVFGNITINNENGVDLIDNSRINDRLIFTNGILYIDDYQLILGENSDITGNNSSRYIRLNGALSDQGVLKLFNAGATDFTFPVGVSGKYTPVNYSITANTGTNAHIILKPVNSRHPATFESPAYTPNELQYYWNVQSNGFAGLNVSHTYNYIEADALPDETNYVIGRYDKTTYSWVTPPTGNEIDAAGNNFFIDNVSYIDGEYTCGVDANFQNLPVYYSRNATLGGNWNNVNSWTLNSDGTGGPAPSYPQGNPVVIRPGHTITMDIDNAAAYSVDISGTFDLALTRYHSLGHITGNGTIRIAANAAPNDIYVFPGGYYDAFMTTEGSTVEFYGTNSGSLPLKPGNIYKPYQNVIFSGNSAKRMSSENLKVLNDLTIRNGSILTNSFYNKDIYISGDWINENVAAGGFIAGKGLVSFEGSAPQDITITNNIVESFYNFRINNPSGVSIINGAGDVDVNNDLYLKSGNITTNSVSSFTLNSTGTAVVIGGGEASFINGPLRKRILNSSYFDFPVGKTLPRNRYGNVSVLNTNTSGAQIWTAEYFDSNPHPAYDTSLLADPISQVSGNEYWNIIGPAGGHSNVKIRWDDLSELISASPSLRQQLRVAEFLPAGWTSIGQEVTDGGISYGTVETTSPVALDNHVFTIGISSVPTVRITGSTTLSICNDGSEAIINMVFTDAVNAPFDFSYTINGGVPQTVLNAGSSYSLVFDGAALGGSGTYTIEITEVWDNTGREGIIRSPSQVDITVLPTPADDITGPVNVGTNTTSAYSTTSTHTDSYSWTLFPLLGTVNNSTTRTPTVDWGASAGLSTLTVVKTSSEGCSTTSNLDISISLSPQPDIQGPANVCAGTTQTYYVTNNPGHTYSWDVAPGGTIQGPANGHSINVLWGSAANDVLVSVIETNVGSGLSGTDDLSVNIGFVPQSDRTVNVINPTICSGGSSTIRIQNSENNVAYQLRNDADDTPVGSYVGGTGGIADIVVTPSTTTTYNILAYTSAPFGCQVELNGTYTVTVNTPPATPTVGTITQPTCAVAMGSVELSGLPPGNWTINPGAISGTGATYTVTDLAEGTYNYRVTDEAGCVSPASSDIIINAQPGALPIPTVSTITQPDCVVPTGTIMVSDPLGVEYEYSIDEVNYQANPEFDGLAPGNYALTTRLAASPACISGSSGTVTIDPVPIVPGIPTASVTVRPTCTVPTGTIMISDPLGAGYEYSIDGVNYQASPEFDGLAPGNYILTTRLAASPTCVSEPTGNIGVNFAPGIQPVAERIMAANTGSYPEGYVDVVCAGTEDARYYVTGDPTAIYNWRIPELNIDFTGTQEILVDWLAGGNFTIELEKISSDGCVSEIRDTMVMVSQPPVPDLGGDVSLCEGKSIVLETEDEYESYLWHDLSSGSSYTAEVTGPVSVTVIDEWNCMGSDTVMVSVHPNPVIDLGRDTIICGDQYIILDAGNYETYVWSTGANTRRITVYAGIANYSVTVTDANGCQAHDEIRIGECIPVDLLVIPNTFTPNDDGYHDEWIIQNIEMFPNADIQVFDRWGRRVFHGKAGDRWNGTGPNGLLLPVETYYYIIDLKVNDGKLLKGTITIIR